MFFMLMIFPHIYAQDASGPEVIIETHPAMPAAGSHWTLTLLVDHPVPNEVTVLPPAFTGSLLLDSHVKNPKYTETRVKTAVEYRFIPNNSGRITLGSFTVISPSGVTETSPLTLNVRGPAEEQKLLIPRIVWEGAPSQMAVGDTASITLRVTGWNSSQPAHEFFMPEVPQKMILELSPLQTEERAKGIAVKLILIPLESGDFRLPAQILHYENVRFEIPALRIRAVLTNTNPADKEPILAADTAFSGDLQRFPEFDSTAFKSIINRTYMEQCEEIYNTSRELWNNNRYAQTLAELRRNERDHPAGVLLRPIRTEAEQKLGLFDTENENRRYRKFLMGLSSALFVLVIISPFGCYMLLRGSLWKKAALLCTVIFTAAGSFSLYRVINSGSKTPSNVKIGLSGVTNETPVRRVADFAGEETLIFKEGQPVIILQNTGLWVYVRANDTTGVSGWIPAEKVIFY
jgi:hypothetical protein